MSSYPQYPEQYPQGQQYAPGQVMQHPQGQVLQYPGGQVPQQPGIQPVFVVTSPQQQNQPSGQFQHALCGCFDNCGICILTLFLPCYTFGKTAEAVGSSCIGWGLGYFCFACLIGGVIRGKVRSEKGINGSVIGDFCTHCWCPLCAIVQDHNEVVPGAMGESMARQ